MDAIMIILLALGAIILLAILMLVYYYNRFKSLDNQAQADWNMIEPILQQRLDTIPNLITMAKRVMKQETDLFGEISKARESAVKATTMNEKLQANAKLETLVTGFYARAEAYPELKSDNTMRVAMEELSGIEDKIKYGRQKYGYTVESYINSTTTIPGVLFAKMFNIDSNKWAYFKAEAAAQKGINAGELLK